MATDYDREWRRLEKRLLDAGGKKVCRPRNEDEDIGKILERGKLWKNRRLLMRGKPSECHSNTAELWSLNRGRAWIVTGYALSRDGIWRQHSWLWDEISDRIVETTVIRLKYYGFPLTDDEAEYFEYYNY